MHPKPITMTICVIFSVSEMPPIWPLPLDSMHELVSNVPLMVCVICVNWKIWRLMWFQNTRPFNWHRFCNCHHRSNAFKSHCQHVNDHGANTNTIRLHMNWPIINVCRPHGNWAPIQMAVLHLWRLIVMCAECAGIISADDDTRFGNEMGFLVDYSIIFEVSRENIVYWMRGLFVCTLFF